MSPAQNHTLLAALEANWQAEMEGRATYLALSKKESDPRRRKVPRQLAAAEQHHADLWAEKTRTLGGPTLS